MTVTPSVTFCTPLDGVLSTLRDMVELGPRTAFPRCTSESPSNRGHREDTGPFPGYEDGTP